MTMPLGFQLAIAALIGIGFGFLLGWLFGRGRSGTVDNRLENDLQQRLTQREGELNKALNEVLQAKTALATAQANHVSAEKLLTDQRALHERAMAEAKEAQ